MVKNTPAVTRVEECTRADTGVGAAIAAGSHLEKGIWALFVIAAIIIIMGIWGRLCEAHMLRMFHWPWLRVQAMDRRIMTSPIRLARAVIIPAARDFGF